MRNKVISNLIWRFLERCGAQLVTFIVSVVLARILSPADYGQIAIIMVIISILQVFVDSGFGNALIQKKDADNDDYTVVFAFNIVVCLLLYLLLFIFAPIIGVFYNDPELVILTRVLGLTIVISSLKNIQQAYVSKNLMFKKFFFATIIGTLISAVVGIIMAFIGFGVWAIVAQHLVNTLIDTLILWIAVKWRPSRTLQFKKLKPLFLYGYKLLFSTLIYTLYNNFRQLIIGKWYSSSELAFYNRGKQLPNLLTVNINNSMDSVLFPVMADVQDNKDKLKEMLLKAIRMSCFIMLPLLIGLASAAKPLISWMLTDKWLECVPYLQVFCILYMTYPIQTTNLNAIKALGRSDLYLKLEIIESAYAVILLLLAVKRGALWIAIMFMVGEIINCVVITIMTGRLLDLGLIKQFNAIWKYFACSLVMGMVVFGIGYIISSKYSIFIQVPIGVISYIVLAKLFGLKELDDIIGFLNSRSRH